MCVRAFCTVVCKSMPITPRSAQQWMSLVKALPARSALHACYEELCLLPRLLFEAVCLQPPCRPHSSQTVHSISRSKSCIARSCCACAERKLLRQRTVILSEAALIFCWMCSRIYRFEQFRLASKTNSCSPSQSMFCVSESWVGTQGFGWHARALK